MKEIRTKIDIEAPLTEVWSLFSNCEKYGDWNPFLLEVKGSLIEVSVIKIKARFNDGSLRDAEPKVDKVVLGESACFVAKKGFYLLEGTILFLKSYLALVHDLFMGKLSMACCLCYFGIKWSTR